MYDIKVDLTNNVIETTLGGMITTDEVSAYVVELKRAFIVHRLHSYSMVIDVSACPIQQQDMIQAMGAHMTSMPKAKSLAIATGSSLARMQIRRLFTQSYARIVRTAEEGKAWVISGIEPTSH